MGISGRWYGKSVLARSFSFQRLPAEKIRNEERLIREAKVRLVRVINRLGVVRGNGRIRPINLPAQALERHLGGPPGLMKIFKLR